MRWDYACHVGHVHVVTHCKQNHVGRTRLLKPIPRNWQGGEFCCPVRAKICSRKIPFKRWKWNQLPADGSVQGQISRRNSCHLCQITTRIRQQSTPKSLFIQVSSVFGSIRHFLPHVGAISYKYLNTGQAQRNQETYPPCVIFSIQSRCKGRSSL